MSRHAARVISLAVLIAVGGTGTSGAQTASPPSLGVLVDQVLALFPKVDGEVIEVQGSTITLSLGSRRSEEHTSELQSPVHLVCRLLLEKKKYRLHPLLVMLIASVKFLPAQTR